MDETLLSMLEVLQSGVTWYKVGIKELNGFKIQAFLFDDIKTSNYLFDWV